MGDFDDLEGHDPKAEDEKAEPVKEEKPEPKPAPSPSPGSGKH